MISVQFPKPDFRIKTEAGKELIFDTLRRKWLQLTPEEWVRQNFIQYLIRNRNYSSTLIAQEKELKLGELKKRFDILVYDKDHKPWMMIECKSGTISLEPAVLEQVLRYNITIPVSFLVITNGITTVGWERTGNKLQLINELPRHP